MGALEESVHRENHLIGFPQVQYARKTSFLACMLVRTRAFCRATWRTYARMCPGIKERFGEDIFERLEREGQMQITWPNRSNPDIDPSKKFVWTLYKEVHHTLSAHRHIFPTSVRLYS